MDLMPVSDGLCVVAAFNSISPEPFSEQAAPTVYTNFTQTQL